MKLKVIGHDNLIRDTRSNAIVNNDKSEYSVYMRRARAREIQGDEIRNAVKEINILKQELTDIKELLKKVIEK